MHGAIIKILTLNLLTTTIVAPPSNASKWQMGFNSAFEGLKDTLNHDVSEADSVSFSSEDAPK